MFCKEHQPVFLFIMCFYILIHRICDHFRILHRLYHGLCTGHYISGCENPRHGGLSICICLEQSPIIYLQLFIPVHDPILRSLRNRNNDTVSRNKPGSLFFFTSFPSSVHSTSQIMAPSSRISMAVCRYSNSTPSSFAYSTSFGDAAGISVME